MTARLLGCLLVLGTAVVAALKPVSGMGEAVVLGVLFAVHIAAFLSGRPPVSAMATGFAAGLLWLGLVVILPPVAATIGPAVVLTAVAVAGTLWLTRRPVAALHSAVAAVLSIVAFAWLLLAHGPAGLVPHDRIPVAQTRIEAADHYLWLLLIGAALSAGVIVYAAVDAKRGRVRGPGPVRLVG